MWLCAVCVGCPQRMRARHPFNKSPFCMFRLNCVRARALRSLNKTALLRSHIQIQIKCNKNMLIFPLTIFPILACAIHRYFHFILPVRCATAEKKTQQTCSDAAFLLHRSVARSLSVCRLLSFRFSLSASSFVFNPIFVVFPNRNGFFFLLSYYKMTPFCLILTKPNTSDLLQQYVTLWFDCVVHLFHL